MTLQKKDLSKFLKYAKKICSKNAYVVLNNIVVWSDKSGLHLYCTNLDTWFFGNLPYLETDGFDIDSQSFGRTLYTLPSLVESIRGSKKKTIEIHTVDTDLFIDGVKIERSDRNFSDFPNYSFKTNARSLSGFLEESSVLSHVEKFVSTDGTRYFMNGVYFEMNKGKINLTGTDGRTLCTIPGTLGNYQIHDPEKNTNSSDNFILKPVSQFTDLGLYKFITGKVGNTKNIQFFDDKFVLSVGTIMGQFPNYYKVIPDLKHYEQLNIAHDQMMECIEEMKQFFKMKGIKPKHTKHVMFDENGISYQGYDTNEEPYTHTFGLNTNLVDTSFWLDFEYLKNIYSLDKPRKIYIHKEIPGTKALVFKEENTGMIELIMPLSK